MSAVAIGRKTAVPSGVLAMLLFVVVEAMFFGGLISAFAIIKSGSMVWPPPGQPRLPVTTTAFNTAFLLISGAVLLFTHRRLAGSARQVMLWTTTSTALGALFVALQGVEWVQLLGQGLTLTSSSMGSFFYLLVGMHALHAVVAIGVLVVLVVRLRRLIQSGRDELGEEHRAFFQAAAVFWYFVVLLWPILYVQVYL